MNTNQRRLIRAHLCKFVVQQPRDVLMSTLENATHPKALANLAKHLAFTRCGELNFNGMVEAQITIFESELLADNSLVS